MERERVMKKLFKWRGVNRSYGRQVNRVLSKKELLQISLSTISTIGSHTINHPTLKCENSRRSDFEIMGSKKRRERSIKKNHRILLSLWVRSDFEERSIERVQKAGYHFAVTNIQNSVCSDTNKFLIPRRLIRNWGVPEFKENIDIFFTN